MPEPRGVARIAVRIALGAATIGLLVAQGRAWMQQRDIELAYRFVEAHEPAPESLACTCGCDRLGHAWPTRISTSDTSGRRFAIAAKRRVQRYVAMSFLTGITTLCAAALCATSPSFAQSPIAISATALVSEKWPLRRADRREIGILSQATACGERVFLLALTRKTIYLADLKRGELGIALGPEVLGNLSVLGKRADLLAMFVDCESDVVSIVVPTKVVSFALKTGQPLRTYDLPPEFAPTRGVASYDRTNRRVFLTGLWPPTPLAWLKKPAESMFSDTTFGLMLSLDNGSVSRFLPRAEEGCRSYVGAA